MARYIDVDKLIADCEEEIVDYDEDLQRHFVVKAVPTEYIEDFPTADVAEVKHGKWIGSLDFPIMQAMIRCSLCNEPSITMSKFCPNCGAKMDLKEGETK